MLNKEIKKYTKIIFLFLGILNIYLSDSVTILATSIFSLFPFVEFKKISKYLKVILILIVITILLCSIYYIYIYVYTTRDIYTLGGRIYIWEAGLKFLRDYPSGVIELSDQYYLYTDYYGNEAFSHAHNQFINEMMRNGIVGGVLFIFYFIYLNYLIFKSERKLFVMIFSTFLACMMDGIIFLEMQYVYYFAVPMIIGYCRLFNTM
ncbi:O-antigen ligase family protein [Anoxybacillus sp. D401a]|uniref:O-antigen ligase family protein n=1 Tax=Anoxybacillus sp. D401a TaxID=575112 RepID=UPI003D34A85C